MNFILRVKAFSTVLLFGTTLAAIYAQATSLKPKVPTSIDSQGHRGARTYRPENTIPAFQYGLHAGVKTLEFDLWVTKDGHLVITHDPYINPEICQMETGEKITSKLAIYSMTLAELKKIDCGTLKNPRFPNQVPVPGTKIPTLEEFFAWVDSESDPRAKKVRFNVEAKSEGATLELGPDPETVARMVLDALKKHGVTDRCTFQSFDFRILRAARKMDPKITLSALIEDRPKEALVDIATSLNVQIVSPNEEWLTAQDVALLHQGGYRVVPWTANTEASWAKLIQFGVDGIISDDPTNLLSYLKKRGIQGSCEDGLMPKKP